jgi:hypothetical protein
VVSTSQQEHFSHFSPSRRSMKEAEERAADMMKMKTTEKRMVVVYFELDN